MVCCIVSGRSSFTSQLRTCSPRRPWDARLRTFLKFLLRPCFFEVEQTHIWNLSWSFALFQCVTPHAGRHSRLAGQSFAFFQPRDNASIVVLACLLLRPSLCKYVWMYACVYMFKFSVNSSPKMGVCGRIMYTVYCFRYEL